MMSKGGLTFFLVIVAAVMVFTWMYFVFAIEAPGATDPGTVALLASFVTMFIKMAADAVGFHFGSSAGSEKKDETQAKVAERLAAKTTNGDKMRFTWWSLFTEEEKKKFDVAAQTDGRVKAFIVAAQMGRAEDPDLDYLVSVGALTQDRADFIQAS